MLTTENKRLVERMLAGEVNRIDQWADDGVWIIPGSTRWSGTYRGKAEISKNLLGPLTAELETLGNFQIENIIAEGDYVVVQGHAIGRRTKSGAAYNNTYCLVFEIIEGKIRKLTEYCDTELITAAFGAGSIPALLQEGANRADNPPAA